MTRFHVGEGPVETTKAPLFARETHLQRHRNNSGGMHDVGYGALRVGRRAFGKVKTTAEALPFVGWTLHGDCVGSSRRRTRFPEKGGTCHLPAFL